MEESINHQETELKVPFNLVTFVEIQKVCQDRVIKDNQIWFEAYIPKFLQNHSFLPAFDLKKSLIYGVQDHISQLKEYIKFLEAQGDKMLTYPPLYLDIKIRKLIGDVNAVLQQPTTDANPFAAPQEQEKLRGPHGHYLPELVQDFNANKLDIGLINALGGSFRRDWNNRNLNSKDPISLKLEELAEPLRRILRRIIQIFADPAGFAYEGLKDDKKNIITFYTVFKFLLPAEERNLLIVQALVPTSPVKLGKTPGFMGEEMFNKLTEKPNSFTGLINRDRFLMLNYPDTDLETIHTAAKPFFFSSEFPDVLLSDPKDLGLNDPVMKKLTEKPEQRALRKKANLDRLLYQVYVLARADGTIPATAPMDNQKILAALKDWVEGTDAFDEELPIISEMEPIEENMGEGVPEGKRKSDPKSKFQQLIPAPVFKRMYVPLLQHICSKIIGCDFNKMTDKPEFIQKYEKFGNFDDMKKDNALSSMIPAEILAKINDKLADKNVAELDKNLDSYFDDFEPFDDQELEDQGGQEFSGKVDSPTRTPKKKEQKKLPDETILMPDSETIEMSPTEMHSVQMLENDNIEVKNPVKVEQMRVKSQRKRIEKAAATHAENPFLSQFIPAGEKVTDQGMKVIDKLLDKAETADKPEKAATINTLLLKFILERLDNRKKDPSMPDDGMKIVDKVNKRLVDNLLGSFSFQDTKGIRNFFEKEKNRVGNMRFDPENSLDQKFFKFDMIFFYYFAAEAKAARVAKEVKENNADMTELAKEMANVATAAKAVNQRFNLGLEKLTEIRAEVKSIVNRNVALMERIAAYDFFVGFLDFFNYFEDIKMGSSAEYTNYSAVFMNFYKFLVRLRTTIGVKIENPHRFALFNLERCLEYTEDVVVTSLNMVDEVCVMSHRKYAEMYYFYKLYLIARNKIADLPLAPYRGRSIDTHVRIFLNFALQNPNYSSKLSDHCAVTTEPICVSWDLFQSIISYLHDKTEASDSLVPTFRKHYSAENSPVKFAIIGALEAVYMNVASGSMICWAKYQSMIFDLKKNGIDVTKFDERDLELLANYYSRTYKKLVFSSEEEKVSQVVRRILHIVSADDKLAAFMHFIPNFNTYYHFDGAKFFLLLSQTPAEFRTIAEATVKYNQGHTLFELNNLQNHNNLILFIREIAQISGDVAIKDKIAAFIYKDYENTKGRSMMCTESEFRSNGMDLDEEALLNEFLNEMAHDGTSAEEEVVDKDINKELSKPNPEKPLVVTSQVIEVSVDAESRIAKALGFNLDNEMEVKQEPGTRMPNIEELIENKIVLNKEGLSLAELDQAMELKKKFAEALGAKIAQNELEHPTDTHSGLLDGSLSSSSKKKRNNAKKNKFEI